VVAGRSIKYTKIFIFLVSLLLGKGLADMYDFKKYVISVII